MFNLTEDRVNVNHHAILLDIVTRRKFRYDGYLTISVIKLLLSVVVVVVDGWLGEVREIFGRRLGDIRRSVPYLHYSRPPTGTTILVSGYCSFCASGHDDVLCISEIFDC